MHSAGQNILQSWHLGISEGTVCTIIHHTGKLSTNHRIWQVKYHPQQGSVDIHPCIRNSKSIPGIYSSSLLELRVYQRKAGDHRLPHEEEWLYACGWSSSESPSRHSQAGQVLWPLCQANLLLLFQYNKVLAIFITPCSIRALKTLCIDACPSYRKMPVTLECAFLTFTPWTKKNWNLLRRIFLKTCSINRINFPSAK